MTEPQNFDDKLREAIQASSTSPVRWERVAALTRRRTIVALLSLILVGVVLTVLLSLGALAGKSALDPSFRPPLLSSASGEIDMAKPKLGWSLLESGLTGSSGYLMRADLDVSGLKNTRLVVEWLVSPSGKTKGRSHLSKVRLDRLVPRSSSEHRTVEQWIPRPRHTGLYRVQVILKSSGGTVLDEDRSNPVYVVADDCCAQYKTPMYASLFPKGWHLDENFAPNPGERFVTLARGPAENSLDIDTSLVDPENKGRNPLKKARELRELLAQNGTGYQLLSWHRYQLRGSLAVEWSYRLEGDAFTDIFFYRGPSGFAVLGRSAPEHFRETRDLARLVAKSVNPRS